MLTGGIIALLAVASSGATCFAASRDVSIGTELAANALTKVPCRTKAARARIWYDRTRRTAVAASPISARTYLGHVVGQAEPLVDKGEVLTLRSSVGPVIIERTVIAMQPARSGGRIFVRDAEGNVFAAPLVVEGKR